MPVTTAEPDGLAWLLATRRPTALEPFLTGPGQDRASLERWHAEGLIHPVAGGVYLARAWSGLPSARCAALRLLLRPGAVVGMASAVWARGGPGRRPPPPDAGRNVQDRDDHDVDVIVPGRPGHSRPREGVRARQLALGPEDVERCHGTPLTTPLRTTVDLLMWGTDRDQDALDWLWSHGVGPLRVRDDLRGRPSSPWTARALDVLSRVRRRQVAPLASVPLTDPVTVWARGRDALSLNASQ